DVRRVERRAGPTHHRFAAGLRPPADVRVDHRERRDGLRGQSLLPGPGEVAHPLVREMIFNMKERSMMKRLALVLAVAVISAPALAQQKMEKVVASWLPIMQTMAYYVAMEEKLFEKAGIEIDSKMFQNPNQIIDSLVAGQADFGPPGAAAGITVLAEARYPGTFKVFGLQGGGIKVKLINDGLIVKNDSTIASFKDLKGKSLGHLPGIQWRTISRHIVRSNGLDPDKDVRLQEIAVALQVPSVVAGSVDATLSLEPVG